MATRAPDAPRLPPSARFPVMAIPDPNFPKIQSSIQLLNNIKNDVLLDDVERTRLFQSPVGNDLNQIIHACKAYKSKMETSREAWENAQRANYDTITPDEAKTKINQKKGQFAMLHREYKSCLIGTHCRATAERYQRCWDLEGPDVVKEITETGKFSHGGVCRAEKLAIERCMGHLVSKSIRSAVGNRDSLH